MKQFNRGYEQQLLESYPETLVSQITDEVHQAPLPLQPGFSLPYVSVKAHNNPDNAPNIMYIPGFGEGITNKASFAAQLALQGANVILPGQNRKNILKDAAHKRSATYTQARNYLAVLDHANIKGKITFAPHSYGSIIFDEMVKIAPERFEDADVIMLAPAGSIKGETVPKMVRRLGSMIWSEMTNKTAEFPDKKGVTGRASAKNLLANIPRLFGEIRDLKNRLVDYPGLAKKVGSLSVLSYAEDKMFPDKLLSERLSEAAHNGVVWSVPIAVDRVLSGEIEYSGQGAVHDDEQYNPRRVASAVLDIVRLQS